MPTWIIEPRDPLLARDGRPFGATPGAHAAALPFPYPSTTTGGVRTRAGLGPDGAFDPALRATVLDIAVRGPLLVRLDAAGEIATWLPPAPADALLLPGDAPDSPPRRRRLLPIAPPAGAQSDVDAEGLALVGLPRPPPVKPMRPPPFWTWEQYETWLLGTPDEDRPARLGTPGPVAAARTHVRIARATQTADEGALFATVGREYTAQPGYLESALPRWDEDTRRLALAVVAEGARADFPTAPGPFAPLGGERRLMAWRLSAQELPPCPAEVAERIITAGHCRLLLLTPAHFAAGWRPGSGAGMLGDPADGVRIIVRAAALPRPQVVSGWDFMAGPPKPARPWEPTGQPKPTRRLAPAGSVYFLQLNGSPAARKAWISAHWMRCVSDAAQDQHDGFGLAVLGTWDGQPRPLVMEETDA